MTNKTSMALLSALKDLVSMIEPKEADLQKYMNAKNIILHAEKELQDNVIFIQEVMDLEPVFFTGSKQKILDNNSQI
jgi:hypothetical protein